VGDLYLADEIEYGDILTAVGDLDQLAFEVDSVRFEVVALPHLDSENMVVVPRSLPTRCVMGEEHLGHLEIVERLQRQGIEPI